MPGAVHRVPHASMVMQWQCSALHCTAAADQRHFTLWLDLWMTCKVRVIPYHHHSVTRESRIPHLPCAAHQLPRAHLREMIICGAQHEVYMRCNATQIQDFRRTLCSQVHQVGLARRLPLPGRLGKLCSRGGGGESCCHSQDLPAGRTIFCSQVHQVRLARRLLALAGRRRLLVAARGGRRPLQGGEARWRVGGRRRVQKPLRVQPLCHSGGRLGAGHWRQRAAGRMCDRSMHRYLVIWSFAQVRADSRTVEELAGSKKAACSLRNALLVLTAARCG